MTESPSPLLHFISSGNPQATPVVFLHGGGTGAWMWQAVMDRLTDYYCLAADLPEHGGSAAIQPFSIETGADSVADLIKTVLPTGRAHLVGLSEGAQVLVALLARHPEVVDKALVSSAIVKPIAGTSMLTPGLVGWMYRVSMAPFSNNDGWIRLNMKYSAGLPEEYFEQFKHEFQTIREGEFVHLMMANQKFRLPAGLEKSNSPVLVVAGAHEYKAMQEFAREIAGVLPKGQAYRLDLGKGSNLRSEHNWALTAPDAFAAALKAWFEGNPLPAILTEMGEERGE